MRNFIYLRVNAYHAVEFGWQNFFRCIMTASPIGCGGFLLEGCLQCLGNGKELAVLDEGFRQN